MNNTNSYIMRDQVRDVVNNVMEDSRGFPYFKFFNRASFIVFFIAISTI